MKEALEALKYIEICCDSNNQSHEQIWRIANDAIKELEDKLCKCKMPSPSMTNKCSKCNKPII